MPVNVLVLGLSWTSSKNSYASITISNLVLKIYSIIYKTSTKLEINKI